MYCLSNIVRVITSRINKMGGTCSAHGGGEERCIQGFGAVT